LLTAQLVRQIQIKSALDIDVNCKCWSVSAETSRSGDLNSTPVDFKLSPVDHLVLRSIDDLLQTIPALRVMVSLDAVTFRPIACTDAGARKNQTIEGNAREERVACRGNPPMP
jgi:hypothetical protein